MQTVPVDQSHDKEFTQSYEIDLYKPQVALSLADLKV